MKAPEAAGATHYNEIEEDDVRRALELSVREEAERQERNRVEEERRLLEEAERQERNRIEEERRLLQLEEEEKQVKRERELYEEAMSMTGASRARPGDRPKPES